MKLDIPGDSEATVEIASDQTVTISFVLQGGDMYTVSMPMELADALCGSLDEALNEYESGEEEEEDGE
jgi:hypothetical protein